MTAKLEDVIKLITISYALGIERQIIPMLLPSPQQFVQASQIVIELVEDRQREESHKSKNS